MPARTETRTPGQPQRPSFGHPQALELLARESGERTAQSVQLAIEYDPQPPYDMKTLGGLRAEALKLIDAMS